MPASSLKTYVRSKGSRLSHDQQEKAGTTLGTPHKPGWRAWILELEILVYNRREPPSEIIQEEVHLLVVFCVPWQVNITEVYCKSNKTTLDASTCKDTHSARL